jgi:Flp pilus assembly protein TadD
MALRMAEAACRVNPDHGLFLIVLGAAQYRAGRYPEAVTTLERADRFRTWMSSAVMDWA